MEAQYNPLKNKNSKQSCQIKKSCPLYSGTERALCLLSPFPELRTSMLNNTEKTLARYSKQKSWNAHIRQLEAGLYCFVATHVPILFVSLKTLLKNWTGAVLSPAIQPWTHDYRLSLNLLILEKGALSVMTTQKTVFSSDCHQCQHLSMKRESNAHSCKKIFNSKTLFCLFLTVGLLTLHFYRHISYK